MACHRTVHGVREEKHEMFAWALEQRRWYHLRQLEYRRRDSSRLVAVVCVVPPLEVLTKADSISKSWSFEMINACSGVDTRSSGSVCCRGRHSRGHALCFCRGVLQEGIRMLLLDCDGQTRQDWELPPQWLVEGQVLTNAEDISTSSSFEMID